MQIQLWLRILIGIYSRGIVFIGLDYGFGVHIVCGKVY